MGVDKLSRPRVPDDKAFISKDYQHVTVQGAHTVDLVTYNQQEITTEYNAGCIRLHL